MPTCFFCVLKKSLPEQMFFGQDRRYRTGARPAVNNKKTLVHCP